MPQRVPFDSWLKFSKQLQWVLDDLKSIEVIVDEVLKDLVQMRNLDIELHPVAVKFVVIRVK